MAEGRGKGNRYMNHLCRILSQWMAPETDVKAKVWDLPFRMRSTITTPLDTFAGAGDLLHSRAVGPFLLNVEAKKQEHWEMDGLFNPKCPVWEWWEQCRAQADRVGEYPLLIFSRNRRKDYVLLETETAKCLKLTPHHGPRLSMTCMYGELTLALLLDLVRVPPETVRQLPLRSAEPQS